MVRGDLQTIQEPQLAEDRCAVADRTLQALGLRLTLVPVQSALVVNQTFRHCTKAHQDVRRGSIGRFVLRRNREESQALEHVFIGGNGIHLEQRFAFLVANSGEDLGRCSKVQ